MPFASSIELPMKRNGRGHRTLCTTQTVRALCKLIANGCTIRTACEACGISETAFHDWIRRGENGEQPFAQFAAAVTRARGRGKAALVKSIIDHPDWRGKLELLARVYPEEYSRTGDRPFKVVESNENPFQVNLILETHTKDGVKEELLDAEAQRRLASRFPTLSDVSREEGASN